MITEKLFNSLFPTRGLNPRKYNLVRHRAALINALNKFLPKYGITTYLRVAAFFANCGIETDYFKTTSEYATGWDYDIAYNPKKARSLGNFNKGDGPKYKGGGLSQTTGGYNYAAVQKRVGKRLGVDLVKNPELLRSNIEIAVESGCIFWDDNNLNRYADRCEFKQLSGIVNRGSASRTPLHWEKRLALYDKTKNYIPVNFRLTAPAVSAPSPQQPDNDVAQLSEPIVLTPTEPVVLTPTSPEPTASINPPAVSADASAGGAPPVIVEEKEKSKLREISEKYLKHCPSDTLKNVAGVVAARVGGSVTSVWAMGLHGQILLIVFGVALVGFTAYALYYYTPRILAWVEDIGDSFAPAAQ